MIRRILLTVTLAALLVGCAQRRTYQIQVRNELDRPVTLWLTKDGPPIEAGWKSPERIALERPSTDEPVADVLVPAGHSAETGRVSGRFDADTRAILRIYVGDLKLSEILATGRGNPARVDVPLLPGRNEVIIDRQQGVLTARRITGE